MKKVTALILVILLFVFANTASADSYAAIQEKLFKNAPIKIPVTTKVELSGKIWEIFISYTFPDRIYLLVTVDPDDVSMWGPEDDDFFLAQFYPEDPENLPFAVGDNITVSGKLASIYSSPVLPYIVADSIEIIPAP